MVNRKLGWKVARTVTAASAAIAMLGLLALSGCSSTSAADEPVPPKSELATEEMQIRLDQCKQIEAGLYKCPAFEKDICGPEYTGQATCVRTGKKGSIFVKSNPTN